MILYEVHTADKMYTVEADYFVAQRYGVMFFDNKKNAIAFVPKGALDMVRVAGRTYDSEEMLKKVFDANKSLR